MLHYQPIYLLHAEKMATKKVVIAGDKGSNKTELLLAYDHKGLPSEYVSTVYDDYKLKVDGTETTLALFDMSGTEDYDRLRPLSYTFTDVFLVCFSLDSQASLENACEKWIPEIKYNCPDASYLLVGTNSERKFTTYLNKSEVEKRNDMIRKSGAWRYLECSAATMEGVNDVFESCVRAATQPKTSGIKLICIKFLPLFKRS